MMGADKEVGESPTKELSRHFDEGAITRAVIAELLDYFSDARVTGIRLSQSEALLITVGVVARLHSAGGQWQRETKIPTPSASVSGPTHV